MKSKTKKRMVRTYNVPHMSKRWLEKNEFHYDYTSQLYTYNFSVIKYGKITTMFCVLTANLEDKELWIDVYSVNNGEPYDAFYGYEYGNYSAILKIIHNKIYKQLKRLEIKVTYEHY